MANLAIFKDIQDRVMAFGYGEADRAYVKAMINQADRDLHARFRWPWRESTASVTATLNTPTTVIPSASTVESVRFLRPAFTQILGYEPVFVPAELADPNHFIRKNYTYAPGLPTGLPKRYSIWNDTFFWDPIPDGAYAYTMFFYLAATVEMSADADVPIVPLRYTDYLVQRALQYMAQRDRNMPSAQYWQSLADARVRQMQVDTSIRDGQSIRLAQLPWQEGAVYDHRKVPLVQ